MTVRDRPSGDATNHLLEADDAAHLVGGLRGPIENLPGVRIRCERLALDDADSRQHAEPIGTCEIVALAVQEPLELIETLPSLIGSMLTGTPDASGNFIGLALASPFSG